MYKIYIDKILVHNINIEKLKLGSPELEQELNQPGSLKFTVYPDHTRYSLFKDSNDPARFKKLRSIVEVYKNDSLEFRGRILENENGFYNTKEVICEGELAFLLDAQLRPYSFSGTPTEAFNYYLNEYNNQMTDQPEKQFVIGTVSEKIKDGDTSNTDNVITRSSEDLVSVWEELNKKLIEALGGYLIVKSTNEGKRQIDWVHEDDFPTNSQSVKFGENLLDMTIKVKADEIATAVIPLGADLETAEGEPKQRLTIASLPDGKLTETTDDEIWKKGDYLYSKKGVEEYGLIFSTEKWDDITTDVNHLARVATERLNVTKKAIESIEIKSVDLTGFKIGTKIRVFSKVHGLNGELFPLTKKSLNLANLASNTLTLTKTERTFTETTASVQKAQADTLNLAQRVESIEHNTSGLAGQVDEAKGAVVETTEKFTSEITQTSEGIYTEVAEQYTTKDETTTQINEVKSELIQTAEQVEIRFTETSETITKLRNDLNGELEEIRKWIRFEDGAIILGEDGSEIVLKQQNDRISFFQNDVEIAYISDRKLEIKNADVTHSLKIGNFAFEPQSNGSLSFKKVT